LQAMISGYVYAPGRQARLLMLVSMLSYYW
jgi:hypothetical protein